MTPQYAGLRTLHEENSAKDFQVLAFPCNQFGEQEPGSDAEILEFASSKYQVTFPMFSKIEVNGDNACDLYQFLKAGNPGGDGNEAIVWNFSKFLVGKEGEVLKRFDPTVTPEDIGKKLAEML